ncbi:UNVERIFIED_CONTAM: hypothetical protein Sradi_4868800 [Sesamum radiatum]|uniref:Uncharacterized protein n=1 Tax=Sesamum radiatum TaxID=300843 RepID=A0AAW2MYH6_SESRA
MTNSDNGGDNRSYEGNFSLTPIAGSTISPLDPAAEPANAPTLDPTLGAVDAPTSVLDQTVRPVAINQLCEQLRQFIMKTLHGSQTCRVGPSS